MAALALTQPDRLARRRIDIAGDQRTLDEQAADFTAELGHALSFQLVPHERALEWGEDLAGCPLATGPPGS